MKRARHNLVFCSVAMTALLWAFPAPAQQGMSDPAANQGTAIVTAPAPAASAPGTAMPPVAAPIATPAPAEDPAVSAVMDRLKQDESRISVGDLTAAQDTVARLDLMLQIEKKLAEIEKTRQDRAGASLLPPLDSSSLPPAMSDSSLSGSLPLGGAPSATSGSGQYSVVRITGRQANYSATLMTPEGKQITVRPGDSLSDGSKVSSIAASGVKVTSKSGTKTIPLGN